MIRKVSLHNQVNTCIMKTVIRIVKTNRVKVAKGMKMERRMRNKTAYQKLSLVKATKADKPQLTIVKKMKKIMRRSLNPMKVPDQITQADLQGGT